MNWFITIITVGLLVCAVLLGYAAVRVGSIADDETLKYERTRRDREVDTKR